MKEVIKSKIKISYLLISGVPLLMLPMIALGLFFSPFLMVSYLGLIFLLFLLVLPLGFYFISIKKIPKIEIQNDRIKVKSFRRTLEFIDSKQFTFEEVKRANIWFSMRGGLKIQSQDDEFIFPYHIYSNETEILNALTSKNKTINKTEVKYEFGNIKYLLKSWKNPTLIYFMLSVILFFLALAKNTTDMYSLLFLSLIFFAGIFVFVLTNKYVKLENDKLIEFAPFLIRSKSISIDDIENLNSDKIGGYRMSIKNLTLKLKNNQMLTLMGGLNSQRELKEIERIVNEKILNRSLLK